MFEPQVDQSALDLQRGSALKTLISMPGWNHLLDIMEEHCKDEEGRVLDSISADPLEVYGLQKEAKAARTFFHQVQAVVQYFTTLTEPTEEDQ